MITPERLPIIRRALTALMIELTENIQDAVNDDPGPTGVAVKDLKNWTRDLHELADTYAEVTFTSN